MKSQVRVFVYLSVLGLTLTPVSAAFADTSAALPAPSATLASPSATPPAATAQAAPLKPGELPPFIVDERTQIHSDYNALQKDAQGIEKDCNAATTPQAHALCDYNRKQWQNKMTAIHARERELHRQMDFWRRKQAGLPPPEWYPQPKKNGQGQVTAPGQPEPDHSVLLPQSTTPVPANTY